MSLHLFRSSLIFFSNVLQFSVYKSYTSFVKFIPKYFILFDAIVNEIIFLTSYLNYSLLRYGNTIDFYIDLIPSDFVELLLVLVFVYVCVCVYSLGFSTYKITSYFGFKMYKPLENVPYIWLFMAVSEIKLFLQLHSVNCTEITWGQQTLLFN